MSVINSNFSNFAAARRIDRTQETLNRSLSRLSSGNRVIQPADDASSVATSEKITAQTQRLRAASINVQNATSFVQTADGNLGGMSKIVSRMSELTALAQDPTKSSSDTALYQVEFSSLQDQLRATIGGTTAEIGGTTSILDPQGTFNGTVLFGPNPSGTTIATGDDTGENQVIPETNLRTGAMLSVISQNSAGAYALSVTSPTATATLDNTLQQIGSARATLGGVEENLSLIGAGLATESENLAAAQSSLSDVNMATESTQLAKYQILSQAGAAMLAQSKQSAQNVLMLLQQPTATV